MFIPVSVPLNAEHINQFFSINFIMFLFINQNKGRIAHQMYIKRTASGKMAHLFQFLEEKNAVTESCLRMKL